MINGPVGLSSLGLMALEIESKQGGVLAKEAHQDNDVRVPVTPSGASLGLFQLPSC